MQKFPSPLSSDAFDFTKSRSQMLIIETVRIGFLLLILVISLIFQALQPEFINYDVLMPTYSMLCCMFLVNTFYIIFFDEQIRYWVATAFLFFLESIFITGLVYYTGINQSIFLFLYLINIILCGFVFGRRGAVVLALWTSTLFSILLVFGPDLHGQTLVFAVGLNNIAFFAVSFLAGLLSEQVNLFGNELQAQGKNLRALKNLNERILENIATGLMTIDSRGEILQFNPAAVGLLDVTGKDLISKSIDSVLPDFMKKLEEIKLNPNMRSGFHFDQIYFNSSQEKLILDMSVSPLLDEEERLTGYVIAFVDSTKVRRLEYQMRQSEKLAAVGQLAAGIAHEIRNPLASISGSIQLLGSSFSSRQEEEKKLMSIVLKEIDRLNNLISEFLEYVRPDTLKDDPIDLSLIMDEILEVVKMDKIWRAETEVKKNWKTHKLISGNKDKLRQALLNIVINAIQAMAEVAKPKLTVTLIEDSSQHIILRIRDSGIGIEEPRLRKIFDPFHTTKPKGTGLGLAVTHKIIEMHNAKIFVESTINVGTEFILEFIGRVEDMSNSGLAELAGKTDDRSKIGEKIQRSVG